MAGTIIDTRSLFNGQNEGQFVLYFPPGTTQERSKEFSEAYNIFVQKLDRYMKNTVATLYDHSLDSFETLLDKSYNWCVNFCKRLGLKNIIDNNIDSNSDKEIIRQINNKLYSLTFGTRDKRLNKYILEFFQDFLVGYGDSDDGLRNIFVNIFKQVESLCQKKLDEKIISFLQNQSTSNIQNIEQYINANKNFKFSQIKGNKKLNEELSDIIKNIITEAEFNGIKQEIEKLDLIEDLDKKIGNISFVFEKKEILTNKKGKRYIKYKINFNKDNDKTIDFFSNLFYNFMIKAANKYKAPRAASNAIKDFLDEQQDNIIKELKIGIKSYDFSKIKEKKDFTGFYGEVINTVILKTLNQTYQGTNAIQIGANKEFQKLNEQKANGGQKIGPQTPSDILMKGFFGEEDRTPIRVQVKQWGQSFREGHGLGRGFFSYYPYPKNLNYFYGTQEGLPSLKTFNILRFLIANESVYEDTSKIDLDLDKKPELFIHLIPGFLRISNYVNYIKSEVNENDLFIIAGYYIPSFFILKKIRKEIKNIQKENNIIKIINKRKEDNYEERFNGFFYYYNEIKSRNMKNAGSDKHKLMKSKNIFAQAMESYRGDPNYSLNNYKGEFGVFYNGLDISQKILKDLI